MNKQSAEGYGRVKQSRFPPSLFAIFFVILLLMSGVHTGLITLGNKEGWGSVVQTLVPMLYWGLVASGLTLFTRRKIRIAYEKPLHKLGEATKRVADGDFSVFVPTLNTPDKLDYLDIMIMDFNKMVEELGSIETLKTDFFSNVSHEFKTPLAVIQSNAELLNGEHISEERRRECAETILQAMKRLSSLIMNMLKLNKLEKQAIRPMPQTYDLCAQLCDCALQFEDRWEEKKIDFAADLEDRAVIQADEGLLEVVWTNLLSNAIKFTPAGGAVTLSQTSDEKEILVSVSDTGCGMSEEIKKHIFDKFYQGDSSHSTEGNGLGLALVQRILQLSDASILVESTEGQGSVFTVRLPKAIAQEEKSI